VWPSFIPTYNTRTKKKLPQKKNLISRAERVYLAGVDGVIPNVGPPIVVEDDPLGVKARDYTYVYI